MTMHNEELVRERAYQIWEDEGRPEGASERHWQQAAADVAQSQSPQTGPGSVSDGKGSPAQEALAEASAAPPSDISTERRRRKAV